MGELPGQQTHSLLKEEVSKGGIGWGFPFLNAFASA